MFFNHCKTLDELKAEYRKLALANHPDHGGDLETMKRINAEYDARFEQLKHEHNAANPDRQTSETAGAFRRIINILMGLSGITVELCGRWLWISGDTKPHKDALKAAGCRWSQNKKMWSWHHPEEWSKYRKGSSSMNQIRNKYGSQVIGSDGSYYEHQRDMIGA